MKTSNTAPSVLNGSEEASLHFDRVFTRVGIHPYDEVTWEKRMAQLSDETGKSLFQVPDAEFPIFWSQTAANVVVSKYFHWKTANQEKSLRQLINRVVKTIVTWGKQQHYFATDEDAETFENELIYLLLHQYASFNSPVWFNCGIEPKPQCSACFILHVEDTMESILEQVKTEGMLFKWGSGSGTNFSSLRSSKERLSGGGIASGPVSFMRGFDSFAGVIKSGGKTRRAAKMVILNVDHPDVEQFITVKGDEEKKAWALIDSGYSGDFNAPGGAYESINFQNANHSVRVSDSFMKAVESDVEWHTKAITTGEVMDTYKAKGLLHKIAENAHICGDPGIQYDTTINEWHTCPNSGKINASNPCSEYMFLDNSACNLASLNLMKFRRDDGTFDVEKYKAAVHLMITAQEIIVDNASYPTPQIQENSKKYRPLGLGYSNLGAFLMSKGVGYDSPEGRAWAAVLTALLSGQAYKTSAQIAAERGAFDGYPPNEIPMLKVIKNHSQKIQDINSNLLPSELIETAESLWNEAYDLGREYGFRNAQVSVLAPTGTIAFMMDCDTTGVEPDLALIKYKKLVGGGTIKIVNKTVPMALTTLGYTPDEIDAIVEYISEQETIEGAPHIKSEHLPVFDCALQPANGERYIHHMGHVKMMAAIQPFISGAISKTVNMPNESTIQDIMNVYLEGWRLGLKSIAIYRDGSKRTQPLTTGKKENKEQNQTKPAEQAEPQGVVEDKPRRRRLPSERKSITHKFNVGGHKGYITVGMYTDGMPGEIFLVMAKEGSTISGLMDAFATAISMSLQYGVPLKELIDKFIHTRFEPSGWTDNPRIRMAKSLLDYIFRWMAFKFLPREDWRDVGLNGNLDDVETAEKEETGDAEKWADLDEDSLNRTVEEKRQKLLEVSDEKQDLSDGIPCPWCGGIMMRAGSCYVCPQCGETTGCG